MIYDIDYRSDFFLHENLKRDNKKENIETENL